ncbi:MAG: ATP-NAD kinase family protein [Candidatus Hadarchaeota archaeon]
MKKIGLIVNPIAGMGGRVGLKGTDGEAVLEKARELGARPVSPERAVRMIRKLATFKGSFSIVTYPNEMGKDEVKAAGLDAEVIGSITPGRTRAEDTKVAAREMARLEVDLILVVGGDGTLRDVHDSVGQDVPVLGVPAGVKVHSAAFSTSPEAAAETVTKFLWEELPLKEAEVMDVDEEAYRSGRLSAKLHGFVLTPYEPTLLQGTKLASLEVEEEAEQHGAIAKQVIESMEPEKVYLLGPGTSTRAVAEALGEEKTLLGVDAVKNGKIIHRDLNEKAILNLLEGVKAVIIVSPIGGQGFILGRGNQQLSPEVVRKAGKENIWVIATPHKLSQTLALRVDTGDLALDQELKGYVRVIAGYRESRMVRTL